MAAPIYYRRSWRLLGPFHDYLIVPALEVRLEEWPRRVPEELVVPLLGGWTRNLSLHPMMVEIYEYLGGCFPTGLTVFQWEQAKEQLRQTLTEAFRRKLLVALREEHPQGYISPRISAPEPAAQERTPTTWIALRLEDEDGAPVQGQRYHLKTPDGSIREGFSGPDGIVRIENIREGSCEVKFPGLDAAAWRLA